MNWPGASVTLSEASAMMLGLTIVRFMLQRFSVQQQVHLTSLALCLVGWFAIHIALSQPTVAELDW